ncbi:MAG: hypothetical protein A4E49_00761 [Methanosaeta sp. PtaU1.Bin112]|nr:MAG: hypothetical protein A4E49_00761 [Methanosaeta sp. PtaU1.Bin112]
MAALVNPMGLDRGLESVTLFHIISEPIILKGWNLADSEKKNAPNPEF